MPDETLNTAQLPAPSYPSSDHSSTTTAAVTQAAVVGERYQMLAEIAHGGMGVVYRAIDTALSREVAVKVLQGKFGLDSAVAHRFADEARIAAQLQHPAIPPIHDIGTLPDGRPFLAMKLIKGLTLEELLATRPDPSAERGRFVAVFEQVCQAMAYAHAHHVIHRDLKPANVMVGAYGEVQVMDWGLAKVLNARPSEEADPNQTRAGTEVVSLRGFDGLFTLAGSVMGTPAFMPPEQAIGAVAKVDQRSDVFGLGGILAVILTGQPPFAAASTETMRVKAAQGDVSDCFARLDDCGAEPELVALCKRCLNPRASERPADAGEVAAAVARLRQAAEERARAAELERVRAEGERVAAELRTAEERKRRRVQWALAVAVALLLVGGLAFGWWQAERQKRNADAVVTLLKQCEDSLRAGHVDKAAVTLEAAQKRAAEGGGSGQAERLARCQDDLAVLRALDAVNTFRWTWLGSGFPALEAVASRYGEVLDGFGANPDKVGAETAAARVSGSAVRERLVTALDWLLAAQKSIALREALKASDPDPFRDAVRDAVCNNDGAALVQLADQAEALTQPPEFVAFLGTRDAIGRERRRELLNSALQKHSGDLGLLMAMAESYPTDRQEEAEERVRWYQAAIAVAPANYSAYTNLGMALWDKGDMDGAIAAAQQAIGINPNYAPAHNNLGNALYRKGDVDGAIAEYREAMRLDPRYAPTYNNLGSVRYESKDMDGAIANYRQAIQLDSKFARAHDNLGNALQAQGNLTGAIAAWREVIRIDPKFAPAHHKLGNALYQQKAMDRAIAEFRQAIQLDPKNAKTHFNLGCALHDKRELVEAVAEYREAIRINPTYAQAHINLGNALYQQKDVDGAIAAWKEAIRLKPEYVLPRNYLGVGLKARGDLEGAIAAWREAIRIDPKFAPAYKNLGNALLDQGDLDGAIAAYQRAKAQASLRHVQRLRELQIRLPDVLAGKDKPKSPTETCEFAQLCGQPFQKRYADAVRLCKEAFAADPKLADDLKAAHRYNAACYAALAGCGQGVDAVKRNDRDEAKLREQALTWLRADLVLRRRQAGSADSSQRQEAATRLSDWLRDPDLRGVRPGPARTPMSDEEAAAWDKLWADVKATITLAQKTPIATSTK